MGKVVYYSSIKFIIQLIHLSIVDALLKYVVSESILYKLDDFIKLTISSFDGTLLVSKYKSRVFLKTP